jgi:hypothetical protein
MPKRKAGVSTIPGAVAPLTAPFLSFEEGHNIILLYEHRLLHVYRRGEKPMAGKPQDGSKSGEIDKVASEACTRSGAFALLVSVLLFVLCVYWQNRKAEEALSDYASSRWNLAMFLEELQNDRIWKKYIESHPDADQVPLDRLIHAVVEMSVTSPPTAELPKSDELPIRSSIPQQPGNLTTPPPKTQLPKLDQVPGKSAGTQNPNSPLKRPMPPGGLSASEVLQVEPYEIARIVQFWRKLNDSDLLTKSRETSNYFDLSIAKWANRRGRVMYDNALTGVCTASEIDIPNKFAKSDRYVPKINDEALMNCVTFRDVKELAQFELPQIFTSIQLGDRIARDVDLSPGSLPKEPYAASLVAEALLFFALVYFSAFAREAVSTESFPTRGTLFGAFSRTRWMLIVLLLALWTPFLACCAVAFASGKILLGLGAALVLFATFSAQRTLAGKSFFESIRPTAFLATHFRRITGG